MIIAPAPLADGRRARPLRVLHVVQHLKSGGAETFVRGLVAGLHDRGLDVSILSLYPDGLTQAERDELRVPVTSLHRRGRGDVLGFYPRLIAAIRAARPDVVHTHLHAGKYAGRIGALAAGVPAIVFTEHGDEARGAVRRIVSGVLHPRTTRFIVFSDAQRAAFATSERVPLERIVVIPNGVARPPTANRAVVRAGLHIPADAFACYVPARLTPQKDPLLALRAFAAAFPSDESTRLFFAGTGPLEAAVRAEADALGLGERAHFLGFRDDAASLMHGFDVLLMASAWERMPLALGEAMHAGLPIVTTPWDGHRDVVGDGESAFVAPAATVDALAGALRRARDTEAATHVAECARRIAIERFDLATSVAAHAALYAEIART